MAGVILVLGLIAAGVYTGNVAFYWVAGIMGFFYFLFMLVMLSVAAAAKEQMEKMNKEGFTSVSRRNRKP